MGFGKWVLGGVCAVGAVVAAPVVLPAAGLAAAAGVAGVAGVAAGAVQEKKTENAYNKGRKDGNIEASNVYYEKFWEQADDFYTKWQEQTNIINELRKKVAAYKEKEDLTQEEIEERDQLIEELLERTRQLEEEIKEDESGMTDSMTEYISGTKNWALALQ